MGAKHPRIINPFIDEDGVSLDLKVDGNTFNLSVSFNVVYETVGFMDNTFGEAKQSFLDCVLEDITAQCMSIMTEEGDSYELDWNKIIGRTKMVDEFKKGCNFWYKKYWTKNKSEELIKDIKQYITSIIWLSSVNTKDADRGIIDSGTPNMVVVKHFNGEYSIEDTFINILNSKIDYSFYCLREVTGQDFDFFNLAEVIDKGMHMRYEEEYVERERYFQELSDNIIL